MANAKTQVITDTPPEWARMGGFIAGPLLAGLMLLLGAPEGLSAAGWCVAALACWMAIWWITEAMPLAVTSLLPVIILPTFKLAPFKDAVAPFASTIIFLFLGGFIISTAMQKWNLHLRIALSIMRTLGHSPKTVLASMMIATCFLSMWISNTATAVMMFPMALSIATLLTPVGSDNQSFAKALILGIAYSAAIGGLGTFVGTPTNAILQGFMAKTYGVELQLAQWMTFGVPAAMLIAFCGWVILSRRFLRHAVLVDNAHTMIAEEFGKLGPMQHGEKIVAFVFTICVSLWTFGGFVEDWFGIVLSDAVIAVIGAFLLFIIPINFKQGSFALTWKDAERIPWGVLVFFGGSLSLSAALASTGVTTWLGTELEVLSGLPLWIIVLGIVLMIISVSELMSNVATITAFLPVLAALAAGMGVDPLLILVPATMAASCGFMMPSASAANALAFGTGHLRTGEMARSGIRLDIIAAIIITIISLTLLASVFGL